MLRQSKKIASLIALCQKHHDAIGSATLRTSETLRFEARVVMPLTSLFSTQSSTSDGVNLGAPTHSLEFPRQPAPADVSTGLFKAAILRLGGYYSKESRLMRAASGLYSSVTEAVADPALAKEFEIVDDFQHRHALMCLHVWLLLVRLRPEGSEGKELGQVLYDNFQDDLEMIVRRAGVKSKVRGQLSELEKQFYGSCMTYDKALKGGEGSSSSETLSEALWRNVYQNAEGKENAAVRLEKYLQRELACLSQTESEAVMNGNVRFSFAASSSSS